MGLELTGLWFNPNVHPYTEYKKRLEALKRYASLRPLDIIFKDEYDIRPWLQDALEAERSGKKRCEICYRARLTRVAQEAKAGNFKRFSTTLLFSRHQDHELLKNVAFEVAGEQAAVEDAFAAVVPGGKVILTGIPADDKTSFPAGVARRKGLTIKMVRRMKHTYPRAIELVTKGLVDVRSLVTQRFPLEQAAQAFAVAERREGLKVVVTC